jgi:hypothetical protein
VRALLRAALGIYHLDVDLHAELDPGLVATFQPTPHWGPPVTATFPAEQVRWHPAVPA